MATLDQIEAALYAALGALVGTPPSSTQPLRHLRRYAGEVTRELPADLEKGLYELTPEQHPAALLAFEREEPLGADGAFVEVGPHIQVVGRSIWRVYIVARDLRGDEQALKGVGAGQPGALLCAEAVKRALAGLTIAGLFDGRGVRWLGTAPWVIARRVAYVYVLRFAADAALSESDDPLPGTPLQGFRGEVDDAEVDTDGADVSLSTFDDTL